MGVWCCIFEYETSAQHNTEGLFKVIAPSMYYYDSVFLNEFLNQINNDLLKLFVNCWLFEMCELCGCLCETTFENFGFLC